MRISIALMCAAGVAAVFAMTRVTAEPLPRFVPPLEDLVEQAQHKGKMKGKKKGKMKAKMKAALLEMYRWERPNRRAMVAPINASASITIEMTAGLETPTSRTR